MVTHTSITAERVDESSGYDDEILLGGIPDAFHQIRLGQKSLLQGNDQ
ncbi:hypothetical protein [Acidithiobacillus ferridurans]|jgi:hypothetical protein|uniref:Uncharacterized protein n=2 Tax=Acidithiobacillus ferridurans TaxID=1232575 RepID=A0A8X8G4A1_ACIFI|nr:hypothetical protein [Acidithiobacillus ferridurans]MBU2717380.1 hypothetical protein [Acidithiobacillus ferridurans]MBU2722120.1 hypothetical protein [Acidithiobacillus ferridurans]MBU2725352.1 hypothetical protein [Acidithiobacillus ferridurans]BBF65074.1 hypothetical protein AFERRID_12920 [Acidithiobacillus ferridurans]